MLALITATGTVGAGVILGLGIYAVIDAVTRRYRRAQHPLVADHKPTVAEHGSLSSQ